jgi:hypothetical protein
MSQRASSPQDDSLAPLWADVIEAREEVAVMRGARMAAHPSASVARSKLLGALELYAVALATAGRPLPYKLRDELFLCRALEAARFLRR